MSQTVTLPPPLQFRLESVAGRARLLRTIRGVGVLVLFMTLMAGLALAADYFFDLPSLVRQGLFVTWLGLGFGLFCERLFLPVFRRFDDASLAAAVEQTYPALGERLTTSVELAGKDDLRHGRPAFIALLLAETERAAKSLNFLSAVPIRAAVTLATLAGIALVMLLSPAIAWPAEYGDLVHRFLRPWSDLPPYTFTVTPGELTVARGSSVTIEVVVHPRSARIHLPGSASLLLTDADGNESTQRMRIDRGDSFSFPLTVMGDCHYRIEARATAGDTLAASETYLVTAVTLVELAPDSPTITITPPPYARATRDEEVRAGLVDLTALQGSLVRFDLHFTRPAVAGWLEWAGADAKTVKYPLALTDDGRAAELALPAMSSGSYRLTLEAEHSIRNQLDGGTLTVKPDLPPTVIKFAGREELKAVTPYEKVALECALADDVGVAKAEIEYRINDHEPLREAFPLSGAGRMEATGQLQFALDGKVKEGDAVSYRLRVEDNLPKELKGPHVVYSPPDRWLSLQVAHQPGPVREQEIAAQREAVDRRIDAIRQALLQEMRGLYKLKLESRVDPTLTPEQRDSLRSLEGENQGAEKMLREMVKETETNPALQPLAEKARGIADKEMQQSESALHAAGTARMPPADRDGRFKEADNRLGDAVQKLDELKKQNEQIAKDRADQLRFEALAEKEQKLADKAAELAKKDPALDPSAKDQAEQLRREQAETAEELKRLAEQSPMLQKSLEEARAEQAKQAAERARELAEAERALAKAQSDAETERTTARFSEFAEKQRKLAEKATQLAEETKQPARSARVQPLRPDEAKQAADALKQGNANEALRHQDRAARDLDRLADGLDRAIELSRDPREAARHLARLQDDHRQRVMDEMHRNNPDRSVAERVADLSKEQDALRKATEQLSVPPKDPEAAHDRRTATEKAASAAELLRKGDALPALGEMEQTRRALEQLAERLPGLAERQQQALREVAKLRKEQEEIARQAEDAARELRQDDPKAKESGKQKLGEAEQRQAKLAEALSKIDMPKHEARRERSAAAVDRARADLQNGLPEDAAASQQQAKRELERLEQALADRKPADEKARDLAKRQQELADDTARAGNATPQKKEEIQRKQEALARETKALPAPEAPQRQSDATEATRGAEKSAKADPASPETREKMENAARKLDELARQMSGDESDAAKADRLARRQAKAAADAEKQVKEDSNKPPSPEDKKSQEEIAREASQVRGGEDGQSAKRRAEKALDDAQSAPRPQERAQAQKQAADALRELADRLAARKDEGKPGQASPPPAARASPDETNSAPKGLPTKSQSEQARQLARDERELRDAVRKAARDEIADNRQPKNDPVGDLAKQQAEVARQSADLAGEVAKGHGEQSASARQGESASQLTKEAADKMRDGELPAAQKAGKQAAGRLGQLAEDLAKTPPSDGENPEKPLQKHARDLARKQEEINRRSDQLAADPNGRQSRQQARQKEIQQQAGDLEKDLAKLAKEMNGTPNAGQAAEQAAGAAKEAQKQMGQAGKGNSTQARRSQEEAARSLDRAAQQASQAAASQSGSKEGGQQGNKESGQQGNDGSPQAGQSVQQAKDQMEQAQGQLGQGKAQGAQQSMESAARALRQAAGQMSQGKQSGQAAQPGNPGQPGSPSASGVAGGGRPDPSLFGAGIPKYAGKTWGELPGELRTKIVQDMRAKYGEDYARMIKLYFEQLADTKRDGK